MTWTPQEILQEQSDRRVKALQDDILRTIKTHPIASTEVLAALGGCAVYIVGLNVNQFSEAVQLIGKLKSEMRRMLKTHWGHLSDLRKEVARHHHEQEQVHSDTELKDAGDTQTGRPPTESPGEDVPG